ncbi:MAG: hypothetical protein H6834_05500 [Planctomycetes bacterium]|nr:hypothetical protein [Planctomycetota bacterium]MCB9890854.1 hypothetical protein [Planctomycetota bacterium]
MTPNPIAAVVYGTALLIAAWFALREPPTEAKEPAPSTVAGNVTPFDLLDAFRTRKLPDGLELPAFYRDPTLIGTLKQSAFTSPSPLVKQWLLLDSRMKVDVLGVVIDSQHIGWLFAFVGELAYSGIALEPDPGIASQIRLAVLATGVQYAQAAIFLLDHIAQVCPHDTVRTLASRDAQDLRGRVGALGH